MALKILFFILLILSISKVQSAYPEEDGVLVLGDDNLSTALREFKFILVEFYAPWCGHCKSLTPEYAAAAQELNESSSEIKLAKVDATVNKRSAGEYQISGYPTLYYMVNGLKIKYDGPRDRKGIIEWVKKRSQPPSKELSNIRSVEDFLASSEDLDFVVIFFGNIGFEGYMSKVGSIEDVQFGHCLSKECLDYYKVKNGSVIMYKNYDNSQSTLAPGFNAEELQNFINREGTPAIITYSSKYENLIMKNLVPILVFFYNSDSEEAKIIETAASSIAPIVKNKIQIVLSNSNSSDDKELADFVGFASSDLPYIRIADARSKMKVYKFSDAIIADNLIDFVEKWSTDKLTPEKKSEPIPGIQGDVFKLVGLNFNEVVFDPTKDVFIKFHSPNCGHCVQVKPIWEEFARRIKAGGNPNIIIAEIDVTKNDYGFEIARMPLFFFYPATKEKTRDHYDNSAPRSVELFTQFLIEKAVNKVNLRDDL